MTYPTVSKPYGFRPINLIGGQPYAGSTRMFKIASGYNTNIFYGDPVKILRDTNSLLPIDGTIVVQDKSWAQGDMYLSGAIDQPYTIGVFMGCSYTNPYTKQKTFSQYYPAGVVADDIQAYVVDDPDALFKVVFVTNQPNYYDDPFTANGTTPAYANPYYVGRNLLVAVNPGDTNTGNSAYGVTDVYNPLFIVQQPLMPVRVVDVVPETATSAGFVELIVKWNMPGYQSSGESGPIWGGGHEYYWPGSTGSIIL
jgi:hypothetical protein